MSVRGTYLLFLSCEVCGSRKTVQAVSASCANYVALQAGWIIKGGDDGLAFCPSHPQIQLNGEGVKCLR